MSSLLERKTKIFKKVAHSTACLRLASRGVVSLQPSKLKKKFDL